LIAEFRLKPFPHYQQFLALSAAHKDSYPQVLVTGAEKAEQVAKRRQVCVTFDVFETNLS